MGDTVGAVGLGETLGSISTSEGDLLMILVGSGDTVGTSSTGPVGACDKFGIGDTVGAVGAGDTVGVISSGLLGS